MTRNNTIVGLVVAIALALCSLPIKWMTIHNATISGMSFPGFMPQGITAPLNGFNGNVGFWGIQIPIWLFILVGVIGLILKMLNTLRVCSLPKLVVFIPVAFGLLYTLLGLGLGVGSGQITLGIGGFVALVGLGIGALISLAPEPPPAYR